MLRVAIIGCGKIADAHLEQMRRIPGCRPVAACDVEPLMARQLAERFVIEGQFSDVTEMLAAAKPDVVHITTPPASHFKLGKQCLEAGCHVYIEKPFTLNTAEAEELIALAERSGRKLTVGHDLQFSHVSRRMREMVKHGYLGGRPVHMESYYCYDLTDRSYAQALLGNKNHWVRRLPGKLLHNIISHGIARLAEFLDGESVQVHAHGFASPLLVSLNEQEIVDELRVTLVDGNRSTAYFTFSSQMRPSLNAFRIYGPKNGLALDEDQQLLIKLKGARYKSYAERFIPPLISCRQQLVQWYQNARLFLGNDFHMKSGMKTLIESFYASIEQSAPVPIPYREILLTSRIMDQIFDQVSAPARKTLPAPARRASGVEAGEFGGMQVETVPTYRV